MNTQYRKNLKAVLEASKTYADKVANDLRWELGTYDLSVDSDTTTAYTKSVPSNTIMCHINSIGGMSWKINQLVQNGNFVDDTNWSISGYTAIENNTLKVSRSVTTLWGLTQSFTYKAGHKYFISFQFKCDNMSNISTFRVRYPFVQNITKINDTNLNTYSVIGEGSANDIGIQIQLSTATDTNFEIKNVMCFDLTDMGITTTDIATATTELAKRNIHLDVYEPTNSGSIRDTAITSVVSKDSTNTLIETKSINASIQALDGYGWGINENCYNYIDFENKKFNQITTKKTLDGTNYKVDYSPSTTNNYFYRTTITDAKSSATVNTSINAISDKQWTATYWNNVRYGNEVAYAIATPINTNEIWISFPRESAYDSFEKVNTWLQSNPIIIEYELNTPVETDISAYIDNNSITIEAGGTLTFDNTYNQAVPSDIDYLKEVAK